MHEHAWVPGMLKPAAAREQLSQCLILRKSSFSKLQTVL